MEAKISLVLLANGSQAALDRCLDSCFRQSYSEFELLVFTDETVQVAREDERLRVYETSLADPGALRVAALRRATTDYLMFLEAADFLVGTDALAIFMTRLAEQQSDLAITNLVFYKEAELIYPFSRAKTRPITVNNYLLCARLYGGFRRLGGNLIAKDLLTRLGEQLGTLATQDLYLKLCLLAKRPVYLSDACYAYSIENGRQLPAFSWQADYHLGPAAGLVKQIQASHYQASVPEKLTLAVCLDEYSAGKVDVLLYSLERNNPSGGVIYLIYEELTPQTKAWLVRLGQGFVNFKLEFIKLSLLDRHLLNKISLAGNHLPVSAYYRILLPNLLPEVDRVLYLDYDTLVVNDLTSLWQSDLEGHFLGCIRDLGVTIKNGWSNDLLGKYGENYFNSGVLLMDLALLRKYSLTSYFYQFILEATDFFVLGDQDAYNLYFKDAVKYLGVENNYVCKLFSSDLASEHRKLQEINVLHFLSAEKPWRDASNYPKEMLPAVTSYRNYRQELRAKYNLKAEQPALTVLVLVTTALELDRCLESIYYQDYPNLELVVVDMSEAAAVLTSLQKYQAIYGDIKYCQASSTTNAAELIQSWANQAKGELMTVISSKDCFNKNEPFRQMVNYLQQEQLDLIGSMHMRYLTEDGSFRVFPVSGEFEDTGSHSITDLVASYAGEYQQLSGFIFKRELLATSEPATSELELVKNLLAASQKRATWKEYAWILTVK
ncbi:hypothetical protein FC14_GL001303 [Ligilactobacillus agilis DSM 20509]|uniref:Glycosyltransferase 2-like domain-containing protein n=2 Tax=Ligilactobacillus agilis TaxID=1601 RepID=A0A0R2AIU1_9LACO|nr:glycosyltransferase [Ligilactobacillus agilis]KRM65620.1 hypothetical protein FC14_GL001303 [Ligilactobacillus agilis DSM 20509]